MTTIPEMTKRAGVSKATVSRVLPGNDCVNQETKNRVFQAVGESGHRLNLLTRSLAAKTTQTPGLVVTDTLYHGVYSSELLFHIAWMAGDKGCQLLLIDGEHSAEEERWVIQYLFDLRYDMTMIYPRFLSVDEIGDIIDTHNQPTMVLNQRLWKNSSHNVWCDQKQTSFNAVTQFIVAGHREIGFITDSMDSPTGVKRLSGYKDALAYHDIALNNDLIVKGKWAPAYDVAGVDTLSSRKVNFTALVASNDGMAIGVMKQLHGHGVSVPAQISVIGFDDIAPAPYTIPAFFSVKIPATETIQEAIGRLVFMLGGGVFMPSKTFAGGLIARGSAAPPASR